jgi:hypothetical protein
VAGGACQWVRSWVRNENTGTATVFGTIAVMMMENVCSAPKWGANTLEDRTHVRNIRRDNEERPFNRTT